MTNRVTVDVGELNSLKPGEAVIFDCRFSLLDKESGRRSYDEGHIPGAFYMDMEEDLASPVAEHGGRHPLPGRERFEWKLRASGVNRDSLVVCYDEQRLAGAARAWWVLKYFGHDNVHVLNGGLPAWREAGLDLSKRLPSAVTGNVLLQPSPGMVVDMEYVRGRSSGMLVDSRESSRYAGKEEPIDPIAGHIPGAVNQCWAETTDAGGFLCADEFHQERWADIGHDDEIIVYCGSGVTAAVNLLSMEVAGIKGAKLYAGSWSDWISWPENPIATKVNPEGASRD